MNLLNELFRQLKSIRKNNYSTNIQSTSLPIPNFASLMYRKNFTIVSKIVSGKTDAGLHIPLAFGLK
jgi:hypothetical protein